MTPNHRVGLVLPEVNTLRHFTADNCKQDRSLATLISQPNNKITYN